MGRAYITYVYDDGIRHAADSPEEWKNVAVEVGEGILKLCLNPEKHFDAEAGLIRTTYHKVGALQNCLNFVGDVHSSDEEVYMWAGNSLRPLTRLSREEVSRAGDLIKWELKRRPKQPG